MTLKQDMKVYCETFPESLYYKDNAGECPGPRQVTSHD